MIDERSAYNWLKIILLVIGCTIFYKPSSGQGQYFGRNKVQYEKFKFDVLRSPHFDIYNYLDNKRNLKAFGSLSERWYKRHQAIFRDTLPSYNPIILYNNHAHFQQTTVISSQISIGTGGVTEGLRNRVVMPFSPSNAETNHVLGHELVHAFQYNALRESDSTNIQSSQNLPLWMVEGLAEYLSIGSRDAHTSMWLRDALASGDLPTFEDLTKKPNKYFPYRYGHAFWSFVTSHYGDAIIKPLFMKSARRGYETAFDTLLGYNPDSLSTLWHKNIKSAYKPYMKDTMEVVGTSLFTKNNAGTKNISPALSPDGQFITFISDKNVINMDIFMASTSEGKIEKKLSKTVRNAHIDDIAYLESSGAWSPNGERFVLTTFTKGVNKLNVIDVSQEKTIDEIKIPGVEALSDPTWSPDGNTIVATGLVDGQSDLYAYDLQSEEVTQLTNDRFSDLQPKWGPEGEHLVFVSDRGPDTDISNHIFGSNRISIYNANTGEIEVLDVFPGANNISPHFSPDGTSIYFLSNADGFRNLYEYDLNSGNVYRMTKYFRGISGITASSPALSVARQSGQIAYTLFKNGNYQIYKAQPEAFPREQVNPDSVDFTAAQLPPLKAPPINLVNRNLEVYPGIDTTSFTDRPYRGDFSLTYIGNTGGMGVGTSRMGTTMQGGVNMLFGDILKRHQLFTSARLNGRIYDFMGQASYINRESRWNWGVALSHIPYRTGRLDFNENVQYGEGEVDDLTLIMQRTFEDNATLFTHFPISKNLRIEGGAGMTRYSFRIDSIHNYYVNGLRVGQERNKGDAPSGFNIFTANAAFVGDNSHFGYTGPLDGSRYRVQIEKLMGTVNFLSPLLDYRQYFFKKPLSFAFRGIFQGRYGGRADKINPLFLGNEYFVRGYNNGSFQQRTLCVGGDCLSLGNLIGNKLAVANAEVRLPLSGPERLSLIKSSYFLTNLGLFFDGGLAWYDYDNVEYSWQPKSTARTPIFSAGATLRINLFGYAVLEPYYAFPFQNGNVRGGRFGFQISTGAW